MRQRLQPRLKRCPWRCLSDEANVEAEAGPGSGAGSGARIGAEAEAGAK